MLCVALDPLSLAGRDLPIAIYEPEVPRVKLPRATRARTVVSGESLERSATWTKMF